MLTLQPYINQQFNGAIWRLEIDELSDMIFIEVRNEAEKQVSFSALSLNEGQVYFTDLTTPERWLTGIEAVYDGVMLLHNYQSASGPIHKGLVAIDGYERRKHLEQLYLRFRPFKQQWPGGV